MKKICLYAFVLVTLVTTAQNSLNTVDLSSFDQSTTAPTSIYGAQWRTNSKITYIDNSLYTLFEKSIDNSQAKKLVSNTDLETALSSTINESVSLPMIPFNYHWENELEFSFTFQGQNHKYFAVYNIKSQQVTYKIPFASNATEEIVAPNKNFIAYLNDNNIELSFADGSIVKVTNDSIGIVNGSSNTHRQEFGIDRGMWLSPDSKKLLFYKKDERMVSDYPLVDFSTRIASQKPFKYPMAGMKSEEVSLHIYDLEKKTTTKLQIIGDKEQFLTMPTWSPNSKMVYVGILNRGQDHLKLQRYFANNGAFDKQLFEEQSNTYVEPNKPLKFINDNEFIYVSEKDGYRHMYRYNIKGNQLNSYVYNDVVFKDFIDITEKEIYYIGTANRGMDKLLYKVDLKSGKTHIITKSSGSYNIKMNSNHTWYYAQYTNFTTPNNISLKNVTGNKTIELLNVSNPYGSDGPLVEWVTVKAADGKTDLNGRLIYPVDFDENKKYPVMIYVYGGPHAQLVSNRFGAGAGGFDYYMAQQGFVVFTLDNRGSENRGRDFEHVIHRNLGQNEMADQMKGVQYLKTKKYVDSDRIGVYGWSYGGFMTTSLMLNYPETFKVGVAGGPVIDWKWYEVMYGERYMDTPEQNPEGYQLTSTLNKVNNLQGRLLIIHGAQDPVVVQQHSMMFIEQCIKAGKQVDYFLYPSHEHNVRGKDRNHLDAKIADYFMTHLK